MHKNVVLPTNQNLPVNVIYGILGPMAFQNKTLQGDKSA